MDDGVDCGKGDGGSGVAGSTEPGAGSAEGMEQAKGFRQNLQNPTTDVTDSTDDERVDLP
jgi:hypothetical protein